MIKPVSHWVNSKEVITRAKTIVFEHQRGWRHVAFYTVIKTLTKRIWWRPLQQMKTNKMWIMCIIVASLSCRASWLAA